MEAKRRPKSGQELQKVDGKHRTNREASFFLGQVLPKGSKILEKAAMLAADCRLQDWKDWRLRV